MSYAIAKEQESWIFVLTIANAASPTAAEITAGTDITDDIRSVTGFGVDPGYVPVPTMKGGRAPKLTTAGVLQDSSLTMAEHSTYAANTIKQALADNTSGYIVISRYKKAPLAAADKVDVFPVTIGSNNRTHTVDDAPMEYTVSFGLTDDPEIDASVAA